MSLQYHSLEKDIQKHAGLKILSRSVKKEDVLEFLKAAMKTTVPGERANIDAILQVSVSANAAVYEEIKEDNTMCQALRDLMHDEIALEVNKAEKNGEILGFIKGARMMGMTDDQLVEKLTEMYKIPLETARGIVSPVVA